MKRRIANRNFHGLGDLGSTARRPSADGRTSLLCGLALASCCIGGAHLAEAGHEIWRFEGAGGLILGSYSSLYACAYDACGEGSFGKNLPSQFYFDNNKDRFLCTTPIGNMFWRHCNWYVCAPGTEPNADLSSCVAQGPAEATPDLGDPQQCNGNNPPILVANPIHPGTGNKYQSETDYEDPNGGVLTYRRFYNSQIAPRQTAYMGAGWRHSFEYDLVPVTADEVIVVQPDGTNERWLRAGGEFSSVTSPNSRLVETATGWVRFTDAGAQETYDAAGRIQERRDNRGRRVTFGYDGNSRLVSVADEFGRTLTFGYNGSGWIQVVTLPDSGSLTFQYLRDDLYRVNYPGGAYRIYLTDDPTLPDHLTGIVDERGNRIAIWTYDDQGRALSSEHAADSDTYSLTYNVDGTTTVTDPQGRVRTYSFTTQHGVIKVAAMTGGDCSQCGGDAASFSYDANGFVASRTDFNGNTTTYQRDAQGRELSRTEASGTAEARTVVTTWDTALNKPLIVEESGRLTTFTYDTEGRLLSSKIASQP